MKILTLKPKGFSTGTLYVRQTSLSDCSEELWDQYFQTHS